ncbi:hypothetical protein BGZ96_008843 [Linnemannia gamsii]|uniref:Uncharacterized protein n=1 Tax=Linnemannia gamsii TaxID=64522 RepID=A0ABQ7KEQ8_9FUNG|nr:hypothetical protein BGZ96_008843 [Linnemannia gamsii]
MSTKAKPAINRVGRVQTSESLNSLFEKLRDDRAESLESLDSFANFFPKNKRLQTPLKSETEPLTLRGKITRTYGTPTTPRTTTDFFIDLRDGVISSSSSTSKCKKGRFAKTSKNKVVQANKPIPIRNFRSNR